MPHELEPLETAHQDAEFAATLRRVSDEVLETMFFTEAVAADCDHSWFETGVSVRMDFDGSHYGEMWMAISPAAVPAVASAFLGIEPDQTSQAQREQVILELANILCGAVLSALWPESRLLLNAPQLSAWGCPEEGAWHRCLALEEGTLAISIRLSGLGPQGSSN